MDDLETELVDTVMKLAVARRLRQRRLQELRILRDQGEDMVEMERELAESKEVILQLHQKRKEIWVKLVKSRE